jgi:hypothetical protein
LSPLLSIAAVSFMSDRLSSSSISFLRASLSRMIGGPKTLTYEVSGCLTCSTYIGLLTVAAKGVWDHREIVVREALHFFSGHGISVVEQHGQILERLEPSRDRPFTQFSER